MTKRHIKGKTKPRLCGAKGNFEPVGTETDMPICKDCQSIHLENRINRTVIYLLQDAGYNNSYG